MKNMRIPAAHNTGELLREFLHVVSQGHCKTQCLPSVSRSWNRRQGKQMVLVYLVIINEAREQCKGKESRAGGNIPRFPFSP